MTNTIQTATKISNIAVLVQDEDQRTGMYTGQDVLNNWSMLGQDPDQTVSSFDQLYKLIQDSIDNKEYLFVQVGEDTDSIKKVLDDLEQRAEFGEWDEEGEAQMEWTLLRNDFEQEVCSGLFEVYVWSVEYETNVMVVQFV